MSFVKQPLVKATCSAHCLHKPISENGAGLIPQASNLDPTGRKLKEVLAQTWVQNLLTKPREIKSSPFSQLDLRFFRGYLGREPLIDMHTLHAWNASAVDRPASE